jgi:hypothetical protein
LGEWLASSFHRFNSEGNIPAVIEQEAERAPESVWTLYRRKSILLSPGIEPQLFGRPVLSLVAVPTQIFQNRIKKPDVNKNENRRWFFNDFDI